MMCALIFRNLKPAVLLLTTASAAGQGTFQNLDFEDASAFVAQTDSPGSVSVTNALPGWNVYIGTHQETTVMYNEGGIGSTEVVLLGTNGVETTGYRSIEGDFSVLLQGGDIGIPPVPAAASIRQTGLVPASAHSILFKAQPDTLFGVLTVSLNGVSIPYFQISTGSGYTLFGGDVSSFAGTSAELNFSLSRNPDTASSNWNIDSIEFSPSVIPEPGVLGMLTIGGVVFGWAFRRRR